MHNSILTYKKTLDILKAGRLLYVMQYSASSAKAAGQSHQSKKFGQIIRNGTFTV